MGRPKQPVVTIFGRVEEYKHEGMFVFDRVKKIMMCEFCNTRVNWERKSVVDLHCKSDGHIKKKAKSADAKDDSESKKRQKPVDESLDHAQRVKTEKEKFISSTVDAFLAANIPLEKLDDPGLRQWMNKHIKGAGDLPTATHIRRHYLPKMGSDREESLRTALRDKKIVIHCDETTDRAGKAIFVTLFKTLPSKENKDTQLFVAGATVLSEVTGEETSKAIIQLLNKFEVRYENVVGFASDSAAYMNKCYRLLQTLVNPEMIHIQCWAHKLDKINEIFLTKLKRLNECVKNSKKFFKNTRKRKHNYFRFLEERYKAPKTKGPKLFPLPVTSRWGSWKVSSDYLADYVEDLVDYAKSVEDKSDAVASLKYFNGLRSRDVDAIKAEAVFLKEHGTSLYDTIKLFEGNSYPLAHRVYPQIRELLNTFEVLKTAKDSPDVVGEETKKAMNVLNSQKKTNLLERISEVSSACYEKLKRLLEEDAGRTYFEAVEELFHPPKILVTSSLLASGTPLLSEYKNAIPMFADVPISEFQVMYGVFAAEIRDAIAKRQGQEKNDIVFDVLCGMLGTSSSASTGNEFALKALQAIYMCGKC